MQCQVYKRQNLKARQTIEGPAIIQEKEATTLIEDKWHLWMDQFGNLVIEKDWDTPLFFHNRALNYHEVASL